METVTNPSEKKWRKKLDPSKNLPAAAAQTVWPKVKLHVAFHCGKLLKQATS